MGDPNFDNYYSSTVEFLSSATHQQSTVQGGLRPEVVQFGRGEALLQQLGAVGVHCPIAGEKNPSPLFRG
jgi:hypothetical protein